MHPFCRTLRDSCTDIQKDADAAAAVKQGFEDILATEQSSVDSKEVMGRILDVVLHHPEISAIFRQFIGPDGIRGHQLAPLDLPSLQELFDTLRLVKNTIVSERQITDEDVAAESLAQTTTSQPSSKTRGLGTGSQK